MAARCDCQHRRRTRPPRPSQMGDRRWWDMARHLRKLDVTPEGLEAAAARVARPLEALSREALLARGLTDERIRELGRRRGYKWIEVGLEDLELAGLIRQRWSDERLDDRIDVLERRREGRQVLATLFKPALRRQLDLLWDAMHEYGGGTFWCGRFFRAYWADAIEQAGRD